MWLLFTILFCLCLASVNYFDTYLAQSNPVSEKSSIHVQVGGVTIISTLMAVIGIVGLSFFIPSFEASKTVVFLSIASAVPMVLFWIGYFSLLVKYPSHLVVSLFPISTVFLLLLEVAFGSSITIGALIGVAVLVVGAYLLDAGSFRWKIPTALLISILPFMFLRASSWYLVRSATENASELLVSWYQLVGIFFMGVILFAVRPYRQGFLERMKKQGKSLLGFSVINESLSQLGYVFAIFAVAVAPLATYFTALGGIQSLLLISLLYLKPIKEKAQINRVQWFAIVLLAVGVFIIEFWK